jgi:hypothetical protein
MKIIQAEKVMCSVTGDLDMAKAFLPPGAGPGLAKL